MGLSYGSLFPKRRDLIGKREVCTSKECEERARVILSFVDQGANPCEDFYSYACGKHLKSRTEEEVDGEVSRIYDENKEIMKNIMMNYPNDTEPENATGKIMMMYQTCMHSPHTDEQELQAIKEILQKLGYVSWPLLGKEKTENKLFPNMKSLLLSTSLRHLFAVNAGPNPLSQGSSIVMMTMGRQTILNVDLQISSTFDDHSARIKALEEVLEMTVRRFRPNASHDDLKALAKDAIGIEVKLSRLADRRAEDWIAKIKEVEEFMPSFPVLELLNGFLKDINTTLQYDDFINLLDRDSFKDTVEYLLTQDVNSLYNYMGLAKAVFLLDSSSATYRKETSRIYNESKIDIPKSSRVEVCTKIFEQVPSMLSRIFILQNFDLATKTAARSVANSIGRAHYRNLQFISWMDQESRKKVIDQLWNMKPVIGFPDNFMNETVTESRFHLLKHFRRNSSYSTMIYWFQKNLAENNLLVLKGSTNLIDETQYEIPRAHYEIVPNKFVITAGLLQGILFNAAVPKFLNLGTIGFITAHEIAHGFQYMGTCCGWAEHFSDSFPNYTRQEFEERADCFKEQYSRIVEPTTNLTLLGVETLNESIADNAGIRVAYKAFRELEQHAPDVALPGLEQFTSEQLFFVSFAMPWCSRYSYETMQYIVETDSHPPPRFRVNTPLQNLEEFSAAFQCKKGSAMRLPDHERCVLW